MSRFIRYFKSNATDAPSVASLGGGVFGRLGGRSSPLSWAMGGTGLRRLLDVVLPQQQLGAEDHIDAWDAGTGTFQPGFPAQMNDLMFFNTPAVADISGAQPAIAAIPGCHHPIRAIARHNRRCAWIWYGAERPAVDRLIKTHHESR